MAFVLTFVGTTNYCSKYFSELQFFRDNRYDEIVCCFAVSCQSQWSDSCAETELSRRLRCVEQIRSYHSLFDGPVLLLSSFSSVVERNKLFEGSRVTASVQIVWAEFAIPGSTTSSERTRKLSVLVSDCHGEVKAAEMRVKFSPYHSRF